MRWNNARVAAVVGASLTFTIVGVGGCRTDTDSTPTRPTLSARAGLPAPHLTRSAKPVPAVSAAPTPEEQVEATVNPTKLPPYVGPTGAIEGTVRMTGDEASEVALRLPSACMDAEKTYGRLFREGKNRAVADVLIAVTGYEGYVPRRGEKVTVGIDRCAFSTRTVAMTYGQRLEAENNDPQNSYIPILHGNRNVALMVAVPKGSPVNLHPHTVGRYELADNMNRPWMSADVFVLKYATHDVTDRDGRFRVEGIPVGKVSVNALLPSIGATAGRKVVIKDGATTKVDFVLSFDRSKYDAKTQPKPSPSAASSSPTPR